MKKFLALFFAAFFVLSNTAYALASLPAISISPATQKVELNAGKIYDGQIRVANLSEDKMRVEVDVKPYSVTSNDYASKDFQTENTYNQMYRWITFDKTLYDIDPNQTISVPYHITTPLSVPDGSQHGVIFIQSIQDPQKGSSVNINARAGALIFANMLDGKTYQSANLLSQKIEPFQLSNPFTTSFSVQNTGNTDIATTYSLKVENVFARGSVFETNATTDDFIVLPDTTRDVQVNWETAQIGIFNVTQTVSFLGKDNSITKTVVFCPIWLLVLISILVLSLIIFIVLKIRKKRKSKVEKQAQEQG